MTDEEKKAINKVKFDMSRPLACKEITICDVDDLIKIINLIQKQEKMINLMSREIYVEHEPHFTSEEDTKQYFYRKVEEDKNEN